MKSIYLPNWVFLATFVSSGILHRFIQNRMLAKVNQTLTEKERVNTSRWSRTRLGSGGQIRLWREYGQLYPGSALIVLYPATLVFAILSLMAVVLLDTR